MVMCRTVVAFGSFGLLMSHFSLALAYVASAPSDDTRLQLNNADRNSGAHPIMTFGGDHLFDFNRDIFRFDLTGFPEAISDGVFKLHVTPIQYENKYDGRTAELYKIKASNAAWIEGTGNKDLNPPAFALEGEPNWYYRDLPNEWDGGPGLGPNSNGSGMALPEDGYEGYGDLLPLSTVTGGPDIQPFDVWEFSIPKDLINDWINDPDVNAGLLLRDSDEDNLFFDGTVYFASKENPNAPGPALVYACSAFGSDFDCDGDVDQDDLTRWEDGLGVNSFADADGDGLSDGRDFLVWQREVGLNSQISSAGTAVPEPSALVLISISTLLVSMRGGVIARNNLAACPSHSEENSSN